MVQTVVVVEGHFAEDVWLEGVFSTKGKALTHLADKARCEGRGIRTDSLGWLEIGLDAYSIREITVDQPIEYELPGG